LGSNERCAAKLPIIVLAGGEKKEGRDNMTVKTEERSALGAERPWYRVK